MAQALRPKTTLPSSDVLLKNRRYRGLAISSVELLAEINSSVASYEAEAQVSSGRISSLEKEIAELRKRYSAADKVIEEHKQISKALSEAQTSLRKKELYVAKLEKGLSDARVEMGQVEEKIDAAKAEERRKADDRLAKIQRMAASQIDWLQKTGVQNFMDYAESRGNLALIRDLKAQKPVDLDKEESSAMALIELHADAEKEMDGVFDTLRHCFGVEKLPTSPALAFEDPVVTELEAVRLGIHPYGSNFFLLAMQTAKGTADHGGATSPAGEGAIAEEGSGEGSDNVRDPDAEDGEENSGESEGATKKTVDPAEGARDVVA